MSAKDSVLFIGARSSPRQGKLHAGANAFVLFDGFEPMTLCNLGLQKSNEVFISLARRAFCLFIWGFAPRVCEALSMGARQRTRGCSPRGLGGVETLVQGM